MKEIHNMFSDEANNVYRTALTLCMNVFVLAVSGQYIPTSRTTMLTGERQTANAIFVVFEWFDRFVPRDSVRLSSKTLRVLRPDGSLLG